MNYTNKLQKLILSIWYSADKQYKWIIWLLSPLSWLFGKIALCRKKYYTSKQNNKTDCFVIVVGNITVGGTGKTPVVVAIVQFLQQQGYKPAIVSRGYKSQNKKFPYAITAESAINIAGDEPWMLHNKLKVPVVIDPNRQCACQYAANNFDINIIVADDGLQHYTMHRDYEIAVIDGTLGFGNGLFIPAGPLREPISRLQQVNAVCINESHDKFTTDLTNVHAFRLRPLKPVRLIDGTAGLTTQIIHAVAGIGNPKRFFKTLTDLGFTVITHVFPDHHSYVATDIQFADDYPVIMTEKDAVKCNAFATDNHWMLPVVAQLPMTMLKNLQQQLIANNSSI